MNQKHFIYRITNLINGKYYIGVTVDPVRRKAQHFSEHRSMNFSIHKAIKKYGKDNFLFEVIEEYETGPKAYDREAELISENKASYNMSPRRGGFADEKHRNTVVDNMKTNNPMFSPETRRKVSNTLKGRKPTVYSDTNLKKSITKMGSNNPQWGNPDASKHLNENRRVCENCGKEMNIGNYTRWHGSKCKG